MGRWKPGGTLMAVFFIEDTVIACESITYTKDDLNTYILLLIESIQDTDRDVAKQALNFLVNVMQQSYPDKDTPSEKSVWHENAYQEWKTWWDTEGQKYFECIANQ